MTSSFSITLACPSFFELTTLDCSFLRRCGHSYIYSDSQWEVNTLSLDFLLSGTESSSVQLFLLRVYEMYFRGTLPTKCIATGEFRQDCKIDKSILMRTETLLSGEAELPYNCS
jgi:hypothetical protein